MKDIIGIGLIIVGLGLGGEALAGSTSSGPPAPQLQGQFDAYSDGQPSEPGNMTVRNSATSGPNDRFAAILPGDSLYVDPQGGNFTTPGPARYLTSAGTVAAAIKIPLATLAEWESFYSGTQTGMPPAGITAIVACRPTTPVLNSASMCNDGGTATSVTKVNGSGTNGYGQLGSSGTATASCSNPPFGTYQVTVPFRCGATGSGVTADGQWTEASASGDSDSCTANSYTSGCSATCPTTSGVTTTYNSCGQVTGTTPCSISCCTTDYVKSCSTSTAVFTDEGTCHGGSFNVANGCSFVSSPCSFSCSPSFGDILGPDSDGCISNYDDCWAAGNWVGGSNCQTTNTWTEPVQVTGCQNTASNGTRSAGPAVIGVSCTCGDWQ